jgi:hypothetical protein
MLISTGREQGEGKGRSSGFLTNGVRGRNDPAEAGAVITVSLFGSHPVASRRKLKFIRQMMVSKVAHARANFVRFRPRDEAFRTPQENRDADSPSKK